MKFTPTFRQVAESWKHAFYLGQPFEIPESRSLSDVPIQTLFYLNEVDRDKNRWRTPWVRWDGRELASIPESRVPKTVLMWMLVNG